MEGRERNIDWLPPTLFTAPTRNPKRNPGICHDWESNQRPLALWDDAQPIEPNHQGKPKFFKSYSLTEMPSWFPMLCSLLSSNKLINPTYSTASLF